MSELVVTNSLRVNIPCDAIRNHQHRPLVVLSPKVRPKRDVYYDIRGLANINPRRKNKENLLQVLLLWLISRHQTGAKERKLELIFWGNILCFWYLGSAYTLLFTRYM